MAVSIAISASAASAIDANNSVVGDCSFYKLKNDEWSAAPYGMDDGNIAKAELTGDGMTMLNTRLWVYIAFGMMPNPITAIREVYDAQLTISQADGKTFILPIQQK